MDKFNAKEISDEVQRRDKAFREEYMAAHPENAKVLAILNSIRAHAQSGLRKYEIPYPSNLTISMLREILPEYGCTLVELYPYDADRRQAVRKYEVTW